MARKRTDPPTLFQHQTPSEKAAGKPGRAFAQYCGKRYYFGPWDSSEAKAAYLTFCAKFISAGLKVPVAPHEIIVSEVCEDYWRHAKAEYSSKGELHMIQTAMQALRRFYGTERAAEFSPYKLDAIIKDAIEAGLTRTGVNARLERIRRAFKWASSRGMVSVSIYAALKTVPGLRRGRMGVKEGRTVRPAPQASVDAVLNDSKTTPTLKALITVHRHTGARSGELLGLRVGDIDRSKDVWEAVIVDHKTEYLDKPRTLFFGAKCQAVLRELILTRPADGYLFSPAQSETERRAMAHANRKTPMSCGNVPGSNVQRRPKRKPRERYTVTSYRHAVANACKRAKVEPFHPHQLRHLFATEVRASHGIEAASVLLGHSGLKVTEVYAEKDYELARRVAGKMC